MQSDVYVALYKFSWQDYQIDKNMFNGKWSLGVDNDP